jgi:hypothetical protein
MNVRRQTGVKRALVTITGTSPTAVIAAQSGYAPEIIQILLHENNGGVRNVTLREETTRMATITLGGSGTVIWDMPGLGEPLHAGSGLFAHLDQSGSVDVMVRYVLHDNRTPTNLNPATYVPSVTRTPNFFGNQ